MVSPFWEVGTVPLKMSEKVNRHGSCSEMPLISGPCSKSITNE